MISKGMAFWTCLWIMMTSYIIIRFHTARSLQYHFHFQQNWNGAFLFGKDKEFPDTFDNGGSNNNELPNAIAVEKAISELKPTITSIESLPQPLHQNSVSTPPNIFITSTNNRSSLVQNKNNTLSTVSQTQAVCPILRKQWKQFCAIVDLINSDNTKGESNSGTALPLGKFMYIFRNLTQSRNITKLLPQGRFGAMYKVRMALVGQTPRLYKRIAVIATYGDQNTMLYMKLRERVVYIINKILGLPFVPESYLSRAPLPWTRVLIRQGKGGGSLRTLLYMIDPSRQPTGGGDYNSYILLLYLLKCALPMNFYSTTAYIQMKYVVDPYSCISTSTDEASAKRMVSLRNLLYSKERICKIPSRIIELLQTSDDVTTNMPTIGQQLVDAFPFVGYHNASKFHVTVGEEIDGRVSEILYWHHEICKGVNDEIIRNDSSIQFLKRSPLTRIDVITRHGGSKIMLMANFKSGQTAYFKLLHVCNSDYLGEGARELLSYFVDRALGLNRFPNVVVRRFFVKYTYPFGLYQNSSSIIPLNLTQAMFNAHFKRYMMPLNSTRKYIDFVFIGTIKNFSRFFCNTEEMLEDLFLKTLYTSTANPHTITQQTFRDMTSILLYDFILHNWDRMGDNWITSSLRITPFDAGNSWYDVRDTGSLVCDRMIQFPTLPLPLEHMNEMLKFDIPKLDRNVNTSCSTVPQDLQLCRFDRFTIEKIRRHGKSLVSRMKAILNNEDQSYVTCMELDRHRIFEGIEQRVAYLLNYLDSCYSRLGEKMYI